MPGRDLLNRTVHKERTIVHWLSFDEPQSRLKKALKRTSFFQDLLHSNDQAPLSAGQKAIRLSALAFVIADISRFKSLSFASVAATLGSIKQHPQSFYTNLLDRIHPQMSEFLSKEYKWTAEETIWAALSCEYVAAAITATQDCHDCKAESDPAAFLSLVYEKILPIISSYHATECSALLRDVLSAFDHCYQNAKHYLEPDFLPQKLLLVEGQTEAILLPLFAEVFEFDFLNNRVLMISGGGANQVAKRFLSYRQTTRLPIACLLDGDAQSQYDVIQQHLDNSDLLFSLAAGEFEDTFELSVFVRLLNHYLQSMTGVNAPSLIEYQPLTEDQFEQGVKRTQILNKIWRGKSLGNFDKVEFAAFVFKNIEKGEDIPEDFKLLIRQLKDRWGS
jgi:hypothetical protein